MSALYKTEIRNKKAGKSGKWWVVVCPDGHIANNYYHPDETKADKHCAHLNAYFGGKVCKQSNS